jgi:hypothetical protein
MKTKDLLTIATAALATATLTVAFHASPLISGNDADPLAAAIAKPKLVANNIEMTLCAAQGREFKAGDQPEFELRAVNTLNQPSDAAICATLTASKPVSGLSRMVPMPALLWRQELVLSLRANETKVLTLAVPTNLPARSAMTVVLSQMGGSGRVPGIVAMRFSTVPPEEVPASSGPVPGNIAGLAASR